MSRAPDRPLLVVSACLLGQACRYDGGSRPNQAALALVEAWQAAAGDVVTVCPEQLGELPTPRPPADLRDGDGHAVLDGRARVRRVSDDADVTAAFVTGAKRAAALARGARWALLKARSPSCGVGTTAIDGRVAPGDGVLAALLQRQRLSLCHEEQAEALAELRSVLARDELPGDPRGQQ